MMRPNYLVAIILRTMPEHQRLTNQGEVLHLLEMSCPPKVPYELHYNIKQFRPICSLHFHLPPPLHQQHPHLSSTIAMNMVHTNPVILMAICTPASRTASVFYLGIPS
ncbi:hypothetical protein GDO78_022991 [Eleutherodactylus coqui]|uniref:Uncharacterized protein n=1 Tax=Eleutherodactylus coqui TaxID=57060 RepID=A0A8J6C1Q2_ELECQ|nr:hypothetical protein GDO78_022991 [Eleutherodactylus coqui]